MKRQKRPLITFIFWGLLFFLIFNMFFSPDKSTDSISPEHRSFNAKGKYLAKAGIMKMVAILASDTNSYDSLNEDWYSGMDNPKEFSIRENVVFFGSSDENNRLNLNAGSLEKRHLTRLGLEEKIAEGLMRYKEKKQVEGFEFMEELFLVDGMSQDVYSRLEDLVTIYRGGDFTVNINTAREDVLQAIVGDKDEVRKILEFRRGPDAKEHTPDDGVFTDTNQVSEFGDLDASLFTVKSNIFRIWARTYFPGNKDIFKGAEAVVERSGKILHWHEY